MTRASIAAGAVAALMDFAVGKGADRSSLSRGSGLDPADLADPDRRIAFDKYVSLMRLAKQLTGDPALALHFGEAFDVAELSIVGLMAQACDSIEAAFSSLGRFNRLMVDVELEEGADGQRYLMSRAGGKLWLIDMRKDPNAFPELTESGFARMACASRRMRDRPFIGEVHVTHPAPSYRDEYDRVFKVPVVFGSDRNALLLTDDDWMGQKSPARSPYVLRVLMERSEALLKELDCAETMSGRVQRLVESRLHDGGLRMSAAAKHLGLSRATLLRRLKDEGTTFEEILDGVRCRLAKQYLAVDGLPVAEAAFLLGYSDAASFSRAFKRWTASSPSDFRKRRDLEGPSIAR